MRQSPPGCALLSLDTQTLPRTRRTPANAARRRRRFALGIDFNQRKRSGERMARLAAGAEQVPCVAQPASAETSAETSTSAATGDDTGCPVVASVSRICASKLSQSSSPMKPLATTVPTSSTNR